MNTTKDHFHDDFILLKVPEFISFLLSHLMLVIPAYPNSISKSKCGRLPGNVPSPFPSCPKPLFQNEANFK